MYLCDSVCLQGPLTAESGTRVHSVDGPWTLTFTHPVTGRRHVMDAIFRKEGGRS